MKRETDHFPKYIQIETVAMCNSRCVMCPIAECTRENRIMDEELFDKIVEELKPYSGWIERVTIQLDGEPLLDKQLDARIAKLKKIGIKCVAFSSNASLMDEGWARRILASGADEVSFSIDGATPETFNYIRQGLDYDKCISNIQGFIQLRNELGSKTEIRIRMAIQDKNVEEFDKFINFWQPLLSERDSVYGKLLIHWGNWLEGYKLPKRQCQKTLNESPCESPWSTFIVTTDGRVPLCCDDFNAKVELGNVKMESITDIWHGEKFSSIRDIHASKGRKGMDLCYDCNTWDPTTKIMPGDQIGVEDI